jgi:hypothetical protein
MGGVVLEHSTRRSFEIDPGAARYASSARGQAQSDVPSSAHADLDVARISGANVMLVGPEHKVSSLIGALVPDLYPAAPFKRREHRPLFVPASSHDAVVIRDVDALTPEEQLRLLDRLSVAKTRAQVVCTASKPLLPLVEAGTFNASLYYRLNTIYIDLR